MSGGERRAWWVLPFVLAALAAVMTLLGAHLVALALMYGAGRSMP